MTVKEPFTRFALRFPLTLGAGAVMLLPLLDMALRVYHGAHTFDALNMAAYTPQEDKG